MRTSNLILKSVLITLITNSAVAEPRVYEEPLLPSTGFNSDCDTAIFNLPAPLLPDGHFDFIGLYNPDATDPADPARDAAALSPDDCTESSNHAIATTTNPIFQAINGFPDVDPRLKNLRTPEVPTPALPDGTRLWLPPQGAASPGLPPTRSLPVEAMTLGEFRAITGSMKLRCRRNGTAKVSIKVSGFRPNALVTVWAIWLTTPPGALDPAPVPQPFGGVPNVLPINKHGNGRFVRELSYCPMDIDADGDQLMMLDLAEHWDGVVYGALPDQPFGDFPFLPNPTDPASFFTSPIGGVVTVNRGVINMTLQRVLSP